MSEKPISDLSAETAAGAHVGRMPNHSASCAPCSSAGPAAASAAPARSTLRLSMSLSSAVGWLTISPSMAHRRISNFGAIQASVRVRRSGSH